MFAEILASTGKEYVRQKDKNCHGSFRVLLIAQSDLPGREE